MAPIIIMIYTVHVCTCVISNLSLAYLVSSLFPNDLRCKAFRDIPDIQIQEQHQGIMTWLPSGKRQQRTMERSSILNGRTHEL